MFGVSEWVGSVGRTPPAAALPEPALPEPAVTCDLTVDERGLVDQLAALERLTCAAAAAKARLSAELHERRVARDTHAGLPAARRGRGVGHEVALARRESPHHGREHLALALALVHDLPDTLDALGLGLIDERRAMIIARESADLTRHDRLCLDATLAPRLPTLGERETLVAARRLAYQLDSAGAEQRCRRARSRRRVTMRSLPDAMARISAEVPAEDAVLVLDSLRQHADLRRAIGDDRARDQVLADELVARLIRPVTSSARNVEVQLVLDATTLLGADATAAPVHLVGHGPLPHGIVADLLADPEAQVLIRRLFAHPTDGTLVAMDSRGIVFTSRLRRLLFARDGETCRTPWCDAPVRHGDHVTPRARGGTTTLDGGQGLCEACNYAKEAPGWRHHTRSQWPARHHVQVTTPTGHTHDSHAPPLPARASPPCACRTVTVEIYRPLRRLDVELTA